MIRSNAKYYSTHPITSAPQAIMFFSMWQEFYIGIKKTGLVLACFFIDLFVINTIPIS